MEVSRVTVCIYRIFFSYLQGKKNSIEISQVAACIYKFFLHLLRKIFFYKNAPGCSSGSCPRSLHFTLLKTSNKTSTTLKRPLSEHNIPSCQKRQDIVQWSILKSWIGASHRNTCRWKVYFFWKIFSRRTIICAI